MSTSLITGYANGPHVTSKQQGACNAASFTAGKYVLNIGECFSYELVSNNLIRVKEGMAINQGRYMCIDRNDYEELTIDNGLQGVKRSDLIVIRYEKNQSTGIETATMMVIKGTSGDSYVDPEHQEGNILEGDLVDDLLLYRVNLDGLNVESVEALFNMKSNMDSVEAEIGSTDISGIGDGTITGGLVELNNSLETIRSHIGMIVQSTTLNTEEKVKAIYGGSQWSRIEGKFILGASSSYLVNTTGGEAYHTLTVNEIPPHTHGSVMDKAGGHTHGGATSSAGAHTHNVTRSQIASSGTARYAIQQSDSSQSTVSTGEAGAHYHSLDIASAGTHTHTLNITNTGGGAAHNNMPPYKAVYIWERTA